MKKLIIVLIVLLFSACNKPNEKPEVADKIVADTIKEEIADDTTAVEDTIVSEFAELHNLTGTYKLTKKRLYCYSSANDTVSVERVYLDSVKLDKDSVWLNAFYTIGHNLAEFARLLLADKDISNRRKSDYFAVAYHGNYYDSLINCCTAGEHEAVFIPIQYNVGFLLTKLGPQYLKVYDRLMELTNEVMFGLGGFFLDVMHGKNVGFAFYDNIESVIVKLYDDVNNGVDVLNVSTDFQKRKKQFIKKLNAFNKNMLIELQEIGFEVLWANAVKNEGSRCKESTYKISKLIYNDYLLEYAFFLAHCYPGESHEHNLYPTGNPDKQN